jgi:DNA-binding protein YbaB
MLEDLLVAALAEAHRHAEAASKERMAGFGAGMSLPPGMKLPF